MPLRSAPSLAGNLTPIAVKFLECLLSEAKSGPKAPSGSPLSGSAHPIAGDGSLSPDSCRPAQGAGTAALGHGTKPLAR